MPLKESYLTKDRVHPDMIKLGNMFKIMQGKTDMYPFFPPGVLQIWLEHKNRYLFAKKFCQGLTLDAACGTGYGKSILELPAGQYVGIDREFSATHTASELNKNVGNFIAADVLHLPFTNYQFDTILSFETIEHIPYSSLDRYFSEIKRVMKQEGKLLVSTPNREVFSPHAGISDKPNLGCHTFEFSLSEFKSLLESKFDKVELFRQGEVSNEDIAHPSSSTARFRRLVGLIKGNLYSVFPCNGYKYQQPRFLLGVCSNPK